MPGIGTIVNALAVIVGSVVGILFKKGLPMPLQKGIMKALGVATIFIGIASAMQEMLVVGPDGGLKTSGVMLMIVSLTLGTLVGELLKIEDWLESIGEKMRRWKIFQDSGSRFTEGFVTATLVTCIGAMAIVGSLRDGLEADPTMLYSKSILDFVSTMIFASTLGIGVLCSVIPMVLYQGSITALAGVIGVYLTADIISGLSMVGSVMIFAMGMNLIYGKKIHVGNMLPSLFIPVLYGLAQMVIARFL